MTFRYSSETGAVRARIDGQELAVLSAVPPLLASVDGDTADPAHDRLYPTAYANEADDREFRRLSRGEIQRGRRRDRDHLAAVLARLRDGRTELTTDEAEACARAVGAARLVIAARHGMFDGDGLPDVPTSPHEAIVAYLGMVQDELVDALLQTPAMQT